MKIQDIKICKSIKIFISICLPVIIHNSKANEPKNNKIKQSLTRHKQVHKDYKT